MSSAICLTPSWRAVTVAGAKVGPQLVKHHSLLGPAGIFSSPESSSPPSCLKLLTFYIKVDERSSFDPPISSSDLIPICKEYFSAETLDFLSFISGPKEKKKKKGKEKMQVPWTQVCVSSRVSAGTRLPPGAPTTKSLQLCPTLCDPIDNSPPGSRVPGILQARTLEWVAIFFSNAWKWKVKVKSLSHVRLLVTPWTAAYQAPPSMGFSRQEYWSGVPLPSPLGRAHSMSPWLEHLQGQHLTTQIAGGSESTSPKSAGIHPPGTYIMKCHL